MSLRGFFLSALAPVFLAAIGVSGVAAEISVSGLLDSSVFLRAGAGDAPAFSYGIEKYANLRMTARLREAATVFADVNLIAIAGDHRVIAAQRLAAQVAAQMAAQAADTGTGVPHASGLFASTPFAAGPNFIAGFELERLYFRINAENARLDAGLMRIPIGHGLVWRPSDFLNPVNPLVTNARPRAVLGAEFSWWPTFDTKIVGFGAAPRDPFSRWGGGGHVGATAEREWSRVVAKVLYAFESPRGGARFGIHRAGLSVKADLELGLVLDLIYSYNRERETGLDGLALSLGFDYSLFRGRLIVMAEYLFSGSGSTTSATGGGHFFNEHYLHAGFTWIFDDFTRAGIALVSGFCDMSFTPVLTFGREIFQGATLTLTAQIPMDGSLFSAGGNRGELGPVPPDGLFPPGIAPFGRYFDFTAMLRLRF